MKKIFGLLLVISLLITLAPMHIASASVKISKTKATLEVDSTLKLKLTGSDSKVSWSTNKKSIVAVNGSGLVTAVSRGKATITATVGSKKYECSVTVVDSNKVITGNNLTDLVAYMKDVSVLYGKESAVAASMIGAEKGVKYLESNVELYEYDMESDTYKSILKTNKVALDGFDIEITVSAVNGKFILLCEDAEDKEKIIDLFMSFK